jgi:Spherulation-specific family 4
MRLLSKITTIFLFVLLLMDVNLLASPNASTYDWGSMQGYERNTASPTNQMKIALPLYSFENITWEEAIKGAQAVGIIVMNPNSGPGVSSESSILSLVEAAQQQGIRVLGYVSTRYANGAITISQAKREIDDYYTWYRVNGIFFDEANNTCAAQAVSYYSTLYNYMKSRSGPDIVILNPGTATGMCYGPISDILVTFEGNYDTYVNNYTYGDWAGNYSSSHFMAVIYSADSIGAMQNAVKLASERNTGLIYITNLNNNDALATLPAYFPQELAAVNSKEGQSYLGSYLTSVAFMVLIGAAFVTLVKAKENIRMSSISRRNSSHKLTS